MAKGCLLLRKLNHVSPGRCSILEKDIRTLGTKMFSGKCETIDSLLQVPDGNLNHSSRILAIYLYIFGNTTVEIYLFSFSFPFYHLV